MNIDIGAERVNRTVGTSKLIGKVNKIVEVIIIMYWSDQSFYTLRADITLGHVNFWIWVLPLPQATMSFC